MAAITLKVNGKSRMVDVDPTTLPANLTDILNVDCG